MKYFTVLLFMALFSNTIWSIEDGKKQNDKYEVYFPIIKNDSLHFIDKNGTTRISTDLEPFTTRAKKEGAYFSKVRDLLFFQRFRHTSKYCVIDEEYSFNAYFLGKAFICIDRNGNKLFTNYCKSLGQFSEGLAKRKEICALLLLNESSMYGYVDSTGKNVIESQFDYAGSFSEGMANVKYDGEYGYINKKGEIIIQTEYEIAKEFSHGLAVVMKNNKYGYINKIGEVEIPLKYEKAWSFKGGMAKVLMGGKYGFISKSGTIVIKPDNEKAFDFIEGIALVVKNKKYYYINETGQIVLKGIYDDMSKYSNGLIPVSANGKWGYIDLKGEEVIGCRYQFASIFKDGLGIIWEDNYPYYINNKGRIISKVFDERDERWLKTKTPLF